MTREPKGSPTMGTGATAEALLPDGIVWAAGGHASDVVLTAIGDGQAAIVPAEARAHVEGCRACTTHLGNAVLLSLHAGREIASLASHADASARAPLPRLAIAVGLAVAVLGLLPSMLDATSPIGTVRRLATYDIPMFASGLQTLGRRLLEPGSPLGLTLTYGAAALLVVMALALVRLVPKKEVSR